MSMGKTISRTLAFKVLAATASLAVTSALVAVTAPPVRAAQTGTVQGTVKDEAGKPIQGAQVLLQGGGAPVPARTDSSGNFSLAGVQPGNYVVTVNVVTFSSSAQTISVQQDITSNVLFSLVKKTIHGTGHVTLPHTRVGDPSSQFRMNSADEGREKSQPNNLYQSTGLLNYKPGVTEDSGQYPHLRGSDQNQINYMTDGIDVRDPVFNQFATNLVTVGITRANVVTGGAPADYGGATGGYLNQVTVNGRDIAPGRPVGGFVETTFGPSGGWNYSGTNTQIGGVLLNNKLDYALSTILFKTKYPGNYQLSELHSSQDESAKFNYYASPSDLFTAYYEHGSENYVNYQTSPNSLFFDTNRLLTDPTTGRQYYSVRDLGTNFIDHSVQTNDLEHFTYKHNFSPSSYLQARVYQLHQGTPGHSEGTANNWNFLATNITGTQLDYANQINKTNNFRAGLAYTDDKGSYFRQIVNVQNGPLSAGQSYSDRNYAAYPKDFAIYLADQIRMMDNKLTLDLGARFNSVTYQVQDSKYLDSIGQSNPSGYTTKSTDPRLGLAYSPNPDLTFRTSYGINSQRPDMRRIQRVAPFDIGAIGTNLNSDPLHQSAVDYSVLPLNRLKLSHAKDFDIGVEKAFNFNQGIAEGLYIIGLTGYKKYVYDLTYLNPANYDLNAGGQTPYLYDNEGTSHVSGVELTLRKSLRPGHQTDWNGYINYTNQVARANVLSANAYFPQFTEYESGNPYFTDSNSSLAGLGVATLPGHDLRTLNHIEFPTDADQRHSIGVVIGKRLSRLFDGALILDAGSGLPFFGGPTNDGTFGGSVGPGFAATHTITGGASNFTQVPIVLNGNVLPPVNPVSGYTGWHYKISMTSNFYLTQSFSLFFNVDNIFDRRTPLSLATGSISGEPYYDKPTAQYPQGQEHFGPNSVITPVFLTVGFRQRF